MKIKQIFITLFLFVLLGELGAQNTEIDSLIKLLNNEMDTTQVQLNNQISYLHWNLDPEKGILYGKKAYKIAKEINFPEGLAMANRALGVNYWGLGDFKKALEHYNEGRLIAEKLNNKTLAAGFILNSGIIYHNQGYYIKAIDNYLESLKVYEEAGLIQFQIKVYTALGNTYFETKNYKKALFYHRKSLEETKRNGGNEGNLALSEMNIGNVFSNLLHSDSALIYYKSSLEFFIQTEYINYQAQLFNNIGSVLIDMQQFDSALTYLNKAMPLYEELGDQNGIASLSGNYATLYKRKGNWNQTIIHSTKQYEIAKLTGAKEQMHFAAQTLAEAYILTNQSDNAYKYFILSQELSDSLLNREMIENMAQSEVQYEFDKKQRELELEQAKQDAMLQAELERQKIFRNWSIAAALLAFIIALLVLKGYRDKQKANIILNTKNLQIQKQADEIEKQRDEIQKQHDFVRSQRDQIQKQKEEITSSIIYASQIQSAMLSPIKSLEEIVNDQFILFKPRDIVSGDFYWFQKKIGNQFIITAADCTGHGVPGAFMSMLGISFLNEIVGNSNNLNSAQVLELLRQKVKQALHQRGNIGGQKDGMDMSLCIINTETLLLQFSGAYNSLYLIRSNDKLKYFSIEEDKIQTEIKTLSNDIDSLIEIKGDRQPISIHIKESNFSLNTIQLIKGDAIFMFSDGYADQIGGDGNRKFMSKNFKQLILNNNHLPMEKQKIILEQSFEQWQQNLPQVDDVLIIGLRF